jgi:IS5 family transposase
MRHRISPADCASQQTDDLFRSRLDQIIAMNHSLVKLTHAMPWDAIAERLGEVLPPEPTGAGRAALPLRLMVGLLYLKHAFNLSDEQVLVRWVENPYHQYFCGEVYFQTELPCDPSSLTRFRNRLGEAGVEELLAQTIEAAKALKAIKVTDLRRVIVDSTVQEKAVAYPTDSRLLEIARGKLVQAVQQQGITLRQTYAREGPRLRRRAGGYAHARQFKRLRRVLKRQRTILGRLLRDVERKANPEQSAALSTLVGRITRLHVQRRHDKNKLYALQAPEVECIGKGKARQPYEFGVKVGVAVTARKGLIVGARSFPGNPYDGDTLAEQLEQAEILSEVAPTTAIVDLGYRGRDIDDIAIVHRGRMKRMARSQRRWLKRRQAVEPTIGHLKSDHRMGRCYLKGAQGDALNVVLAAAGFNLQWLIRWITILWLRILNGLDRLREAIGPDSGNRPGSWLMNPCGE